MSDESAKNRVRDALRGVLDPCSFFMEVPVDIVELGLLESIDVQGSTVRIELLLTSPGCTYMPYIEREIEDSVGGLDGIQTVEVVQNTERIWTRDRMGDEHREKRRQWQAARLQAAGISKYDRTS